MVLYFIYYNILLYYAFVSRGLKGLWFFKSGDTQKNSHAEVRVNYTVWYPVLLYLEFPLPCSVTLRECT